MADIKKVLDLEQLTNYNTALKGKIRWFGTKAQYNAIATKDPHTIYFVSDEQKIYCGDPQKSYGLPFNILVVTSAPATTDGEVGDFAVEQFGDKTYGRWWYKSATDKWTDMTGARLDAYNQFLMGSSFGGSVRVLTSDGADQAKVTLEDEVGKDSYYTRYCINSVKFSEDKTTWFSLNFPTLTANDTVAVVSLTQRKIGFGTADPPTTGVQNGDMYVKYTDDGTTISDPKLYGLIANNWYQIGGSGSAIMDTDWSTTSENGLQNKKITSGITHCYGDGNTTELPSGLKSITFGDTVPTTMNEGDIFFKHRGVGKDYVTTDDLAVTQIPVTVSSTTYAGAIHAHKYGKVVVIEFQGVRATIAGSGEIATVGAEYAPYYGDQIDSMWCSLDASKIGIVQVTNTGLIRVYNYPQDTQFWGSLTYICK